MLDTKKKIATRAHALAQTRQFFDKRNFLEVDVPIHNLYASVDAYIDLFEVKGKGFLHSSPELRMKELLCAGSGDIYFLGHVFRREENGSFHSSEFTMLEYYRIKHHRRCLFKRGDRISIFISWRKRCRDSHL